MAKEAARDYRFAAKIYDSVLERGLRSVREKAAELSGAGAGDRVLEVCCGTGRQAEHYARLGAMVRGIDLSEHMMARAKAKEKENLLFAPGDATALPYDDSSFDISSTGFALHEVGEEMRMKFIAEMSRVTVAGGSLVITDFCVQTQNGLANRFFGGVCRFCERTAGGEHYANYLKWISEGGLTGFAERNGLKVAASFPLHGGAILVVRVENEKTG